MRLYPKKLRNLKSLEREQRKLLKEKKELEKEDFFSLGEILGNNQKGHGDSQSGLPLDFLSGSNPLVNFVSKVVQDAISKKSKSSGRAQQSNTAEDKPKKNLLLVVLKEFAGGYLKWKAIELSYKGVRLLLKVQREKHEDTTKVTV